jgi:CubicO group peptidase (beta-lactamase class C family)
MRAFAIVIVLFIMLAGCTTKEQPARNITADALDSLFKTVPDFWGVVLVAEKGVPIYERAFGLSDVNTGAPVTTSSIFELASVSKQFTAMAVMMLVDEGKLKLGDPI